MKDATSSTAIINNIQKRKHFPKETSIFSAEIYAIELALDLTSKNNKSKYMIFSNYQLAIKNKVE